MRRYFFLLVVFLVLVSCEKNPTTSSESAHIKVVSLFSSYDHVYMEVMNDGGAMASRVSADVTATDNETGKKQTAGFNFGFVDAGEKKSATVKYTINLQNASLAYFNLFWE